MKTNFNQIMEQMVGKRSMLSLSLLASVSMAGYASGKAPASPEQSPVQSAVNMAQDANGVVKGNVVDKNGEPLIGVSVKAVGTKEVTVTDIDGNFAIKAKPGQELELTYMGYAPLKTKAKAVMNLTMQEDTQVLGDVVVTAFQSACGLVNLVTPTAAVVMGALALGRIPYEKWLKFVWKLMLLFLLLTGLLLVLAAALS